MFGIKDSKMQECALEGPPTHPIPESCKSVGRFAEISVPMHLPNLFFNKPTMNAFSFILKRILPAALALAAITIIVVVYSSPKPEAVAEEPRETIVKQNELATIAETLGTKNYQQVSQKQQKFIFDEKDNLILFGKGWSNEIPESESVGGTQLWILNTNTGEETKLTEGFEVREAVIGNNNQVYYTTRDQNLFVTDGINKPKQIQTKVLSPAITKDGKFLIYVKLPPTWSNGDYYEGTLGLTLLNLDTLQEKRLTNNDKDWAPIFTPDGKKIVFLSDDERGKGGFFVINADGSNRIRLTSTDNIPSISEQPVFSPDGKLMAYEADREIWVLEFNKEITKLLKAKKVTKGINPKFSADGKFLTVLPPPDENGNKTDGPAVTIDLSRYFEE